MSETALLHSIDAILNDTQSVAGDFAGAARLLDQAGWTGESDGRGLVIGIDFGGTKLLGAVASPHGTILAELARATHAGAADAQVIDLVHALLAEAGAGLRQVAQVVIGVPGVVDAKGHIGLSPNVAFPADRSFAGRLTEVFNLPVVADNDVNLAAFGEFGQRRSDEAGDLAFVAVGTGVGMGLVVNGQLVRGSHGAAGEIGSMPIWGAAPGRPAGLYEEIMSTAGILQRYHGGGGALSTVRAVFDAADRGDTLAIAAVEAALDDLTQGVGAVVALLDPGTVVLGGGIGSRPGVAERVAQRLKLLVPTYCAVVASRLGARAGLVGALAQASQLARRDLVRRSLARDEVAA